jgi:hypothetical protein
VTYTNGLIGAYRRSVTVVAPTCQGKPCGCDRIGEAVSDLVRTELWRLADVGPIGGVHLGNPAPLQIPGVSGAAIEGVALGGDGQARIGAACIDHEQASMAIVVLEAPSSGRSRLESRIARTLRWPEVTAE